MRDTSTWDSKWKNRFTLDELKELGVPIEHFDLEEVKG